VLTHNFGTTQGMNTSVVDMHGVLFTPTWTRLTQTASPGTRWVTVRDAVNWRVGQLVAVPTSVWKDECRNQNEVRQIQSISADGKNITFTTALQFLHYGYVRAWGYRIGMRVHTRSSARLAAWFSSILTMSPTL
jgi:hypothetical protein